jgi:hypothetical protein
MTCLADQHRTACRRYNHRELGRQSERELSPNLGGRKESGDSGLSLRTDDLNSIGELYSKDHLGQLLSANFSRPTLAAEDDLFLATNLPAANTSW